MWIFTEVDKTSPEIFWYFGDSFILSDYPMFAKIHPMFSVWGSRKKSSKKSRKKNLEKIFEISFLYDHVGNSGKFLELLIFINSIKLLNLNFRDFEKNFTSRKFGIQKLNSKWNWFNFRKSRNLVKLYFFVENDQF